MNNCELDPRYLTRTALYRYYTPEGDLLYIGIAADPPSRNRQHFISAPWMKYASHCRIEWFPSRALAEWAEMKLIEAEEPDFNLDYRPAGAFARLADMWYLEKTGGTPIGEDVRWMTRPERITAARYLDLVECDAPW